MTDNTGNNNNHQYWLGRLRDAEENPRGWVAANPQAGGGSSGAAPSGVPAAAANSNNNYAYWLGRLNQAETRAQNVSGAGIASQ